MSMPNISIIVFLNTPLHVHVVLSAQLHADLIEQAIILKKLWMCGGAGNVRIRV